MDVPVAIEINIICVASAEEVVGLCFAIWIECRQIIQADIDILETDGREPIARQKGPQQIPAVMICFE